MVLEDGYTSEVIQVTDLREYATKKTIITAAAVPIIASLPLAFMSLKETFSTTTIPVTSYVEPSAALSATEPAMNILTQSTALLPPNITEVPMPEIVPVGFVADTSLEMLANVLDPLIQIMVAISFPIASVIMIGGAFFFMLGNSEKAWQTIFNAGLGYVVIQMSPLFLQILRQVGEAV